MRLKLFISSLLISLACLSPSFAQNLEQNLKQFKRIIIADQGRLKPLDSFSKTLLLEISGQSKGHNQWLYEALFEPEKANKRDLFLIENPELREALSLDTKKKRFSFNEIEKSSMKLFELTKQILKKDTENNDLTLFDRQTLKLREDFYAYINITNSFLFSIENKAFEVSKDAQERLGLKSQRNSLYDILENSNKLSEIIAQIKTESSSELEKELLSLSLTIYAWVENFKNFEESFFSERRFTIIPDIEGGNHWLSNWQAVFARDQETRNYLWYLNQIQDNYDKKSFNQHIEDFNNKILKDTGYNKLLIEAEILYNNINPFKYAMIFYFLALLLLLLGFFLKTDLKNYALSSNLTGFALNSLGLILRIIIMQRPPVSNLYETFIFIAWSIALIGLIIYLIEKNNIGILISSLCGFIMLLISFKFAAEGDTMKALIAVLNSNFWLSTHVIAITLGYAGVFAAGVMGHVYVIQKLFKLDKKILSKTKSYILGILGFGLVMSFLGTLLGGIWADQSWGRFWGWDPKENGALLIVLWCTLIFHARLSGLIKDNGLALASIFGCIVVMLSWLGVNLLGVGLHSYGFTSGLAYALLAYSLIEIVFVSISAFYLKDR